MKKTAIILFAFLILLSSGMVQGVLHVCPEKGIVFDKSDCKMHSEVIVKDCCRKIPGKAIADAADDHCCTDAFLFGVSAKFGSFELRNLQSPAHFNIGNQFVGLSHDLSFIHVSQSTHAHAPPPPERYFRNRLCVWII